MSIYLPDRIQDESEALQLDLFTLACHEFLLRLDELRRASSSTMEFRHFKEAFNTVLFRTREGLKTDNINIAQQLFIGEVTQATIRLNRPAVSNILFQVAEAVDRDLLKWDYALHLDELHSQGLALAQLFYEHSGHKVILERLKRTCRVKVEYRSGQTTWSTFSCVRAAHTITLRFNEYHHFQLYTALPCLFMHEYVSHIFTDDTPEVWLEFSDGWMIHAARMFMKREYIEMLHRGTTSYPFTEMHHEQIRAFEELIYALDGDSRDANSVVEEIYDWLNGDSLIDKFWLFTYGLAAIELSNHNRTWHKSFINCLEMWFLEDKQTLKHLISQATDIVALQRNMNPC